MIIFIPSIPRLSFNRKKVSQGKSSDDLSLKKRKTKFDGQVDHLTTWLKGTVAGREAVNIIEQCWRVRLPPDLNV